MTNQPVGRVAVTGDGLSIETERATEVDIWFGPHHRITVRQIESRVEVDLITTHHGVRLDASELNGALEQAIEVLRREFPDATVD